MVEPPIVSVKQGKVRGKICKDIQGGQFYSFQGIPYAKPPIGKLRFKAPQPPEPWEGIRDGTEEGNQCIALDMMLKNVSGSEDCLFLNIYTPNLSQFNSSVSLPVMFWIHGGGFVSGSSSASIYGPDYLLTENIVLVTINYRIGIFGFFNLDDQSLGVPGNAGLKDVVMGLKWVQDNIRQFSGNPNNVTVFGESAGGCIAHYLMLSPLSKGLFHKIIAQSGSALCTWAIARNVVQELAQILNLKTKNEKEILDYLQSMSAEELRTASGKLISTFHANEVRPVAPVVEKPSKDAFITQNPVDIIKSGNYIKVPLIMGYTDREGVLMGILQAPNIQIVHDFETVIPSTLDIKRGSDISKLMAKKIKDFYYGNEEPSLDNIDKFYQMHTDNIFARDIYNAAKYHAMTSSTPVYLYRMSIDTKLNVFKRLYEVKEPGTCHADDIFYLFKSIVSPEIKPGSDEQIAYKRFVRLWTNFARYGDPNPKVPDPLIRVTWKPVKKNEINFLNIDKNLTTGVNPDERNMAFWEEIWRLKSKSKL